MKVKNLDVINIPQAKEIHVKVLAKPVPGKSNTDGMNTNTLTPRSGTQHS